MRESRLRCPSLALIAVLVAGCGENGTEPTVEFDAQVVNGVVQAAMAPVEASMPAQFAMYEFLSTILIPEGELASSRWSMGSTRLMGRYQASAAQAMLRQSQAAAVAGDQVPQSLYGNTYLLDPETLAWVIDETATGAPQNGVRAMWYLTEDAAYVVPLQTQGYIDFTNETVSGIAGMGVRIVRTVGGNLVLADFGMGHEVVETAAGWSEDFVLAGTFADGTEQVVVSMGLADQVSFDTFDESYSWDISYEGPESSYTWALDGSYDGDTGEYTDAYDIVVSRSADVTTLALDLAGMADQQADYGEGTLSHNGTVVANIDVEASEFTFSKPGGGSLSIEEIQELDELSYVMLIYGPVSVMMFVAPFIVIL